MPELPEQAFPWAPGHDSYAERAVSGLCHRARASQAKRRQGKYKQESAGRTNGQETVTWVLRKEGYYTRLIPNFSKSAHPSYELLRDGSDMVRWRKHSDAVRQLKDAVAENTLIHAWVYTTQISLSPPRLMPLSTPQELSEGKKDVLSPLSREERDRENDTYRHTSKSYHHHPRVIKMEAVSRGETYASRDCSCYT